MPMTVLPSHEAFEAMLRPRRPTEDGFLDKYPAWVCVSFSASWCGPCKRLDKESIVAATPSVVWYTCDVDANPTGENTALANVMEQYNAIYNKNGRIGIYTREVRLNNCSYYHYYYYYYYYYYYHYY